MLPILVALAFGYVTFRYGVVLEAMPPETQRPQPTAFIRRYGAKAAPTRMLGVIPGPWG